MAGKSSDSGQGIVRAEPVEEKERVQLSHLVVIKDHLKMHSALSPPLSYRTQMARSIRLGKGQNDLPKNIRWQPIQPLTIPYSSVKARSNQAKLWFEPQTIRNHWSHMISLTFLMMPF